MRYFTLIFIFIFQLKAFSFDKVRNELQIKMYTWDEETQIEFHRKLVHVLNQQSLNSNFDKGALNPPYNVSYFKDLLESFPSVSAYEYLEDTYIFCNYAGWPSYLKNGKCLPPWHRKVRDSKYVKNYGPTYKGKYSCGRSGYIRCNPIMFGKGKSGYGNCVKTNDRDPNKSTLSCLKFVKTDDQIKNLLKELSSNPKKFAQYVAIASEVVRHCKSSFVQVPKYCSEYLNFVKSSLEETVSCHDPTDVISNFKGLVNSENIAAINLLTDGLGDQYKKRHDEIQEEIQKVKDHNRKLIEKGIEEYQNLDQTELMIKTAKRNVSKCFLFGKENKNCTRKNWKRKSVSLGLCGRYAKLAMLGTGKNKGKVFLDNYPWGRKYTYAVNTGDFMKEAGFTNLMDLPSMSNLTPENAPVGAMIVYKSTLNNGKPGHAEVKTGENEYSSDFQSDRPISQKTSRRIPIGIYVKLPDNIKNNLKEIPEV